MSTTIDQRIVEMRFDNKNFESNVSDTMSTLDKLKQKLHLTGASKGLEEINSAAKKVDMSHLSSSVETVGVKFNAMYTIADQALRNITTRVQTTAENMIKALTLDPITTGFQEYETQINAVQTILANTSSKGTTLDDVNGALDQLNKYADKTIYNFTEMTRNIGTFTAAGVDLDTSVNAIQGIANLAAVSGSTSQQASTAMYQLSQALAAGTVKLMDWNSVVNAGMGGQVFQDALKETARVHGIAIDDMIKEQGSFRETLSEGWITSEILTETLQKFTLTTEGLTEAQIEANREMLRAKGYTDDQIEEIFKLGETATDAATKVKTFTQLWDVLKEAAQSGWTQTWELIVGDFEQAKNLLTPLSDFFTGVINKFSDLRNAVLKSALGRTFSSIIDNVNNVLGPVRQTTDAISNIVKSVKDYDNVVNEIIAGKWGNAPTRWQDLTEAGYDWAHAQNLVNERLGSSVRHATNYSEAQNEVTEAQKASIDTISELTEADKKRLIYLSNLTDEQLRAEGLTESQIASLRQLAKIANSLGLTMGEFLLNLDQIDGRWLFINSFKNAGQGLVTVLKAIGKAWRTAFHGDATDEEILEKRSQGLFNLIAAFHKFSTKLKVSDETAEKITRTFKGLFAVVDLVTTVLGGGFKIAFKAITTILSYFHLDILDVTAVIGDILVKIRDWVESLFDLSGILDMIVPVIASGVKVVKGWISAFAELPFVQKIIEKVGNTFTYLKNTDISTVFSNIAEKASVAIGVIKKWVNAFLQLPAVQKIITSVKDAFDSSAKSIKSWTDGFVKLPAVKAFVNAIKSIINAFKNFDIANPLSFEKVIDGIGEAFNKLKNIDFSSIGKYIFGGLDIGLWEGISDVLKTIGEAAERLITKFCEILGIKSPSRVFMALGGFIIAGLIAGLKEGFISVPQSLQGIADKCIGILQSIDWGNIFAVGVSVAGLAFVKKIADVLGAVVSPLESFGDLLEETAGLVKNFSKLTKTFRKVVKSVANIGNSIATNIKTKALKNLAIALAIMAGTIIALTFFDTKELLKAVGVIALLAGILVALSFAMSKLSDSSLEIDGKSKSLKMDGLKSSLLSMAAAILLLAITVKLIGSMNAGEAIQGFIGLAGILVSMLGFMKIAGKVSDPKTLVDIANIGSLMKKIAIAMLLMVLVIKLVSKLSAEEMIQGAVFAGAFVLFVKALTKVTTIGSEHQTANLSKMLVKVMFAMMLMVGVCKLVGLLSPEEMVKGAAFAGAFLLFIKGLTAVTKIGKDDQFVKLSGLIWSVTFSMMLLVGVCKLVDLLSPEQMIKGAIFAGAFLVFVKALVKVTTISNEKQTAKVAGTILAMSVAIGILAAISLLLSLMDVGGMTKGIIAVGALATIMTMMIKATRGANDVKGSIMAMSIAIALMAVAIAGLSFIEPKKLAASVTAMGLLMGIFALMIKATQYAKNTKSMRKTLVELLIVIALMGGAVALLSLIKNPQNAVTAAGAIAILLGTLSAAMFIMGKTGRISTTVTKALYPMVGVIALLGAVVAALSFIPNPQNALPAVTAISILLLAMSGCMVILGTIKSVSKSVTKALYPMVGVIALLGAIVAALSFIPNPANALPAIAGITVLVYVLTGVMAILSGLKVKINNKIIGSLALMGLIALELGAIVAALSFIPNPANALPAIAAISILVYALSGVMTILSGLKVKIDNKIIGSLALMGLIAAELGAIVAALSLIPNPANALPAVAAISILMGVFTLLLIPLSYIGKSAKNATKGVLALTAMVIPLAVFAFALSKLPDLTGTQGSVMVLVNVMTAMTLLLIPLTLIGYLAKSALMGVVSLTAMVAPLAAFAFALSKMPDLTQTQETVILLVNLMTAMTLLLIPLTLIGFLAAGALMGVVSLTAMVVPLAAFAFALSKMPDLTGSIGTINILTNFMVTMTGLLVAVSLVAPLAIMAVGAIAALGLVITAFGVLATAIGALMEKFPSLEEFLDKGLVILNKLAEGIGSMLGNLIAGFTNAIAESLPNLGAKLSEFAMMVQPFIMLSRMVDDKVVEGAGNITKAILMLAVADFVNGIASMVGLGLTGLAADLCGFALGLIPFAAAMKLVDPSAIDAAKTVADLILVLAGAEFISGVTDIVSKLFNIDGMSSLGDNLVSFAGIMVKFSKALTENGDIDTEAINQAASAGMAMTNLAKSIPKSEGFLQDIVGEADLERFGTMCAAFGKAIKDMSDALTTDEGGIAINQSAIDAAVSAGTAMSDLANAIPKSEGFLQDVVGEADLENFGSMCVAFGSAIKSMSDALTTDEGGIAINQSAIDAAVKAGTGMSDLANALPKSEGFLQDVVGEQDLATFGTRVEAFGESIKKMSDSLTGENGEVLINDNAITAAEKAGTMMAAVQAAIPEDKWLDGKISIDDFGSKIESFGSSLAAYSETVSEIEMANVITSITQANRLANLAKKVVDLDTSGIDKFADVSKIADTISAYATTIGEMNIETVSGSITAAERLKKFVASLINLDSSGISNFKLGSIGTIMRTYGNLVKDMNTEVVLGSIASANKLRDFVASLINLDSSGVSNFKLGELGSTLKAYSDSVIGFDAAATSSSVTIGNRLKSFIDSLVGIDTSGVTDYKTAIDTLGTVSLDNFISAFSVELPNLSAMGADMINAIVSGIQSKQGAIGSTGSRIIDIMLKGMSSKTASVVSIVRKLLNDMLGAIRSKNGAFGTAGSNLINKFVSGINKKKSAVKTALSGAISSAVSSIKDYYSDFYDAGSYLVDGFADGIDANTYKAEAKAAAMATAAFEAAKEALKINSPSKLFRSIGYSVPEGFAMGIDKFSGMAVDSAIAMSDNTVKAVGNSIARIADAINSDIDAQPTIRPVMDLTDVRAGAGTINDMLAFGTSVGVMTNVGSISSMMNRNIQNGSNNDIVSAIDKLRKDLGNVGGTSYNINGITYDDGSNVSTAIGELVRAAKLERRM